MDNVDTMRSIPASQCEGGCAGQAGDQMSAPTPERTRAKQHVGHLNKGKDGTHKAPVVTFSALLI